MSNIQTAVFGLYQMYKHSASPRVYESDINLLRGLYIYILHQNAEPNLLIKIILNKIVTDS